MIRDAALSDVIEYFDERGLSMPDSLNCQAFIVDESMLVAFVDIEPMICEAHICVKRKSVRRINKLIESAEAHLKLLGYKVLTTSIEPEYLPSIKLAERIGFKRIGCYNNHIIFCKEL